MVDSPEKLPQDLLDAMRLLEEGNLPVALQRFNQIAKSTTDPDISARCFFYIGSTFEAINLLKESDQAYGLVERLFPQLHWARKAARKRMGLFYNNPFLPPSSFPPYVQIEPTNACNIRCEMCPRTEMTKPVGMMDFELFKKLVDESFSHDVMSLKLYYMGEPLLHPQIVDFATYAVKRRDELVQCGKTTIGFQTNGNWKDNTLPTKLLQAGIDGLSFSFSGIGKNNYEKVRSGASYESLCNNIRECVKLRNELKAPAQISITLNLFNESFDEVKAFKNEWASVVDRVDLIYTVSHPNRNELDKEGNLTPNPASKTLSQNTICVDGLRSLIVRWDGEIGFCCGDYNTSVSLGNANITTLAAAWLSTQRLELHSLICKNELDKIPVCRTCAQRYEISPNTLDVIQKLNTDAK